MKNLLFLLVLVSAFIGFTSLSTLEVDQGPKGIWKKYTDIPASPFSTGTVITPANNCCSDPNLFNYTLLGGVGAGGDGVFTGNFTSGLSLRQFDGDATHIYRFVNAAGAIMGGAGDTHPGIGMTDHGDYVYLYGLSALQPMVVKGERGVGGFGATVAGAHYLLQNIVAKSTTASGFQANGNTSGGSYYSSWIETFCRSFSSGQEAIAYLGKTSAGGAIFNAITITNCFGYSPYRDGWQIELADLFTVSHVTVIGAGRGAESGQTNNIQIIASHGTVTYGIYDNAGTLCTIFANGVRISDNFMSASLPGYIGKSDDLTLNYNLSGLNSHINGDSLIIENNKFKNKGGFTYAFEIAESLANIVFRNNTFEGYSTIILDSRGTHTNTITGTIGTNGNVSASIADPVYVTGYNDPDNYLFQGLVSTSSWPYALHYGYRTP